MSYPSYETLWATEGSGLRLNVEACRLYWIIQSNVSDAVFVMDDAHDPLGPRQPLFQSSTSLDSDPELHPIGRISLCEPPVSSITVGIDELQDWCDSWEEHHCYWDGDDREGPCRCCNRMPPPGDENVTVATSSEGGFVTIADYVGAVHPWLMSLRGDLLWAKNIGEDFPWPEETILMVNLFYPDGLIIETTKDWLSNQRVRLTAPGRQTWV